MFHDRVVAEYNLVPTAFVSDVRARAARYHAINDVLALGKNLLFGRYSSCQGTCRSFPHAQTANLSSHGGPANIGVARILSGVHFFAKKVDDLFLVVALTDRRNTPPNLSHST